MPQNQLQTKDPYTDWLDSLSGDLTETTPTGGLSYRGFFYSTSRVMVALMGKIALIITA